MATAVKDVCSTCNTAIREEGVLCAECNATFHRDCHARAGHCISCLSGKAPLRLPPAGATFTHSAMTLLWVLLIGALAVGARSYIFASGSVADQAHLIAPASNPDFRVDHLRTPLPPRPDGVSPVAPTREPHPLSARWTRVMHGRPRPHAVACAPGSGGPVVLAMGRPLSTELTLVGLDPSNGQTLWSHKCPEGDARTLAVVQGNFVAVLAHLHTAVEVLDRKSGRIVGQVPCDPIPADLVAAGIHDGAVTVTGANWAAEVLAAKAGAGSAGVEVRTFRPHDQILCAHEGFVLTNSFMHGLIAKSLESAKYDWKVNMSELPSACFVDSRHVMLASQTALAAFDRATGKQVGAIPFDQEVRAIDTAGDKILLWTADDRLIVQERSRLLPSPPGKPGASAHVSLPVGLGVGPGGRLELTLQPQSGGHSPAESPGPLEIHRLFRQGLALITAAWTPGSDKTLIRAYELAKILAASKTGRDPVDLAVPPAPPRGGTPFSIALSRGAFFTTWYSVELSSNGIVDWNGKEYVATTGTARGMIPERDVVKLLEELDGCGLAGLSPTYENHQVSDLPDAHLSVQVGEFRKSIYHNHGDLTAPSVLFRMENAVDHAARTDKWIFRGQH